MSKVSGASLWQVVLFALLGGLILNLMPCVLPVLAMKLGSVLMVPQGEQKTIRRQFLLSSSGILVSFWLLALLMTLLRVGQQAVGWGIQFQNPWFIGFMVVVTALFTANLFGLFEINLGSRPIHAWRPQVVMAIVVILARSICDITGNALLCTIFGHSCGLHWLHQWKSCG